MDNNFGPLFVVFVSLLMSIECKEFCQSFGENDNKIDLSFGFRFQNLLLIIGENYWIISVNESEPQFYSNESKTNAFSSEAYNLAFDSVVDQRTVVYLRHKNGKTIDLFDISLTTGSQDFGFNLTENKSIIKSDLSEHNKITFSVLGVDKFGSLDKNNKFEMFKINNTAKGYVVVKDKSTVTDIIDSNLDVIALSTQENSDNSYLVIYYANNSLKYCLTQNKGCEKQFRNDSNVLIYCKPIATTKPKTDPQKVKSNDWTTYLIIAIIIALALISCVLITIYMFIKYKDEDERPGKRKPKQKEFTKQLGKYMQREENLRPLQDLESKRYSKDSSAQSMHSSSFQANTSTLDMDKSIRLKSRQ